MNECVWRWLVNQCNEAYLWYLIFIFLCVSEERSAVKVTLWRWYVFNLFNMLYKVHLAGVNLFSVYRIIKKILWSWTFSCCCINNGSSNNMGVSGKKNLEKVNSCITCVIFFAGLTMSFYTFYKDVLLLTGPKNILNGETCAPCIMCCLLQRISPSTEVKRKSGSCWDADCVISAQNDACVQHKAASDRKDFMKLAGCLASHKVCVGVCGSVNCMCVLYTCSLK